MAIFLITGASGSGKTTLAQKIQNNGLWAECISHTTREMREGEEFGKTYYFATENEFDELDRRGEFVEKVVYHGNKYGISKDEINRVLNKNEHIFIIVDYDGYKQVKEQYPDAIGIFLYMTKEDCMANMLLRGDSLEKASERIETYEEEIKNRSEYDYVVKNIRDRGYYTQKIIEYIIMQHSKIKNPLY